LVGYEEKQVGPSLETLMDADLIERGSHPSHEARL
jgi:hypothetical protein